MKKYNYKHIAIVLTVVSSLVPTMLLAATRTYPVDALGVTEETFAQLQKASCPAYDESLCTPLLKKLDRTVIMRVEQNGELYLVDKADGVPSVRRYLPNGLYVTDGKYYMVYDGFKIRLKKGKAFARVLRMIRSEGFFPLSENDFQLMFTSCENYSDTPDDVAAFNECAEKYADGQKIFKKVSGGLVMRVEANGELYYIDPFDDFVSAANKIGAPMPLSGETFFTFVKKHAEKTSSDTIHSLLQGVYY